MNDLFFGAGMIDGCTACKVGRTSVCGTGLLFSSRSSPIVAIRRSAEFIPHDKLCSLPTTCLPSIASASTALFAYSNCEPVGSPRAKRETRTAGPAGPVWVVRSLCGLSYDVGEVEGSAVAFECWVQAQDDLLTGPPPLCFAGSRTRARGSATVRSSGPTPSSGLIRPSRT